MIAIGTTVPREQTVICKKTNVHVKTNVSNVVKSGRPLTELKMCGKLVKTFLDTGSSATLLKYGALSELKVFNKSPSLSLIGVNGSVLNCIMECDVEFDINKECSNSSGCGCG